VSKRFRQGTQDVPALVDVSLEVPTGSFVSIMGPSGSGKSTLLHLISGIDSPSAGALVIAGRRTSEMSDDEITVFRRRHIGLVFQFFNLLPMLSAEENVALPLILDGVPVREARGRAASLLEDVGLGHRAHHGPDQLSGGEMQRVAVARALVIEPLVLLADEPTGNLDSKAAHEILVLIGAVSRERGQTVIMVTHDPASAKHGERLITLRDGRIVDDAALQGAATA
jgi:ABC-type lipoprotein export system ATPase subunit